jgi:hypothetical protein
MILFNFPDSGRVYLSVYIPSKVISEGSKRKEGKQVDFKVDTGSDLTIMSRDDFESLGFSDEDIRMNSVGLSKMIFANGSEGIGYRIRFESIMLGGIMIKNFEIVCPIGGNFKDNLVGLDFLNWFVVKRDPNKMEFEMAVTTPNKMLYKDLSWDRISVSDVKAEKSFDGSLNLF